MTYVTRAPSLPSLATDPPALNSGSSGCADTTSTRSNFGVRVLFLAVVLRRVVLGAFFVATPLSVRDAATLPRVACRNLLAAGLCRRGQRREWNRRLDRRPQLIDLLRGQTRPRA